MPTAHITVTAVSDEGGQVVVWGRPDHAPDDMPVGYAFQSTGDHDTVALADRASRLASGAAVVVEYTQVVDGWNVGRGLTVS
jgi:hypothetical protein